VYSPDVKGELLSNVPAKVLAENFCVLRLVRRVLLRPVLEYAQRALLVYVCGSHGHRDRIRCVDIHSAIRAGCQSRKLA
jgi:hypothetical protein